MTSDIRGRSSCPAAGSLLVATHPAVAAQLVAMVEALLLREREALPPLVDVAQPRVDLVVVDSAWKSKEGNAEFQVALVLRFSGKVSGRGLRSRIILQITPKLI